MKLFLLASGGSSLPNEQQTAIILHCAGPAAMDVYDHFIFAKADDKDDPETVMEKFGEYCSPRETEVLHTFRFWHHPYTQPFEAFVTDLRTKAQACNFKTEAERMVRDKIVFSVDSHLQERLLRESNLTLDKTIDICRAYESSKKQMQEISQASSMVREQQEIFVDKVQASSSDRVWRGNSATCKFCGIRHVFKKHLCPAWGKTCDGCHGKNHFKKCCKKVNLVDNSCLAEVEALPKADLLAFSHRGERLTALLNVEGRDIRFQIDTAADVNTISARYVDPAIIKKPSLSLVMWNKTKLVPMGEATLLTVNPRSNKSDYITFTVVKDGLTNLLGLETSLKLGFISVNDDKFVSNVCRSDDNKLGNLGEARLMIDKSSKPVVLPCRQVPFSLTTKVKEEVDMLVHRGILVPVDQPTTWVNQMAVVEKSNGKIRICLDPQPLNRALQREHFRLPTFEEVRPQFQNAKLFTKLDVKEAFWHVSLDDESSLLTTMITPWGRFRWSRLPFGLNVSSEIFQKRLIQALEGLPGIVNVADDIVVVGRGRSMAEAEVDHERNLMALRTRCKEKEIVLNDDKTRIKQKEIVFMGHLVSAEGIKPDPGKVQALLTAPTPKDVHEIRRFCGMAQYLAKFVVNISQSLEPLHAMTKKNSVFHWNELCEKAFADTKRKIAEATMLGHYDPNIPLELHVDSSQSGLGCVLLQNNHPLEYASRILSDAEQRWAQIEKEMLAVVYGLERFNQYTYGNDVLVVNDHKPLATIVKKPLSQAPPRLQRLLMRANRYRFQFQWIQGTDLQAADYFSRVHEIHSEEAGAPELKEIQSLETWRRPEGISDSTIVKIKQATENDQMFQDLIKVIRTGWPQSKACVQPSLMPYFSLRDSLSVCDGLVMRGESIVIPPVLRKELKERLHAAHLGFDSMIRRARSCIFWPRISQEIKDLANACEACQALKPMNSRETLMQQPVEELPWEKVASDLFELNGRQYLLLVDYLSNFIEVEPLSSMSSVAVIKILKSNFARYGIPKLLVTDSGSQFTSAEFSQFAASWGFQHYKSDPGHHQANGKAESAVKIVKNMMKKCLTDGKDQYAALLELRCTPRQGFPFSPSQCLFGRNVRSFVPSSKACRLVPREQHTMFQRKLKKNAAMKKEFDKTAHDLASFKGGDAVYFCDGGPGWKRGDVIRRLSARSYLVKDDRGRILRRNRVHLRKRFVPLGTENEGESDSLTSGPVGVGLQQNEPDLRGLRPNTRSPTTAASPRPLRTRRPPTWMRDYVP